MSNMMLYTNPQSRGRIVRWMLEEVGADYDVRIMEFDGNIKSPDYLKLNPMGKVPTLVDGAVVISEVAAICAYLADKFPEKGLSPPVESPLRGDYYRWLFFIAGPLEMALTAKAYQWRIDDENVRAVGCGKVEDTLNTVEQALSANPYLCGGQFTTADLLMGSYLGWEMSIMKTIEPRQVFVDYVERCNGREAGKRADALDDALIKESA